MSRVDELLNANASKREYIVKIERIAWKLIDMGKFPDQNNIDDFKKVETELNIVQGKYYD